MDKPKRMTRRERIAARVYAATGSVSAAAKQAGYAGHPGASMALSKPHVQAEVARVQLERITTELLPLAVDVHARLLRDERAPAAARVAAVRLAYEYGSRLGLATDDKPIDQLSAAEIAERIERLQAARAERARPIIDADPVAVRSADPSVFD